MKSIALLGGPFTATYRREITRSGRTSAERPLCLSRIYNARSPLSRFVRKGRLATDPLADDYRAPRYPSASERRIADRVGRLSLAIVTFRLALQNEASAAGDRRAEAGCGDCRSGAARSADCRACWRRSARDCFVGG